MNSGLALPCVAHDVTHLPAHVQAGIYTLAPGPTEQAQGGGMSAAAGPGSGKQRCSWGFTSLPFFPVFGTYGRPR